MRWKTVNQLQGNTEQATTLTHLYVLFFDAIEKMFKVIYIEHSTGEVGHKLWSTKEQAKEWVENVHVPAKEVV